ncbi:MAG: terminase large subunit domain-containing protein [Terriglobales bacterium]
MPDPPTLASVAALEGLDLPLDWTPQSQPQLQALLNGADLLLFGGSAGSLKSETLLVDAALELSNPHLRAILFRRSYPELEKTLIRRSRQLYAGRGGRFNEQKRVWTFPSGATVEFAYCEAEEDIFRYQGAEYTFIGFDESTHFTEFPIRYMFSRLRSRDPKLRLRLRLASNPGNVGHNFHKALFHGPACTHCQAMPNSERPGFHCEHGVWPSDGATIGKTKAFIPGTCRDHSLLNRDYADALAALPGAFRKALLEGCWDVYEGQYFDNWRRERMSIPRARIGEQPWWPHWVGADYGFNGSQAAAYLFCKGPASPQFPHGRTYVLDEYTARHQKAAEFAQAMARRFGSAAPQTAQIVGAVDAPRVQCWYLSPDAWSKRGDDHSLAEQMRAASDLPFEPASTDRVGGAMLIYSQLDSGELVIADTCRQLLEAIPSRIHDPDRPDDILKIAGDPLDDCIDAFRYGLYSFLAPPKPSAWDQLEAAISPDPTVAMLQRRRAAARWGSSAGGAAAPASTRYIPRRR